MVWIAFWSDWNVRSDVIISTIALAGFTPEPSARPLRAVSANRPTSGSAPT